MVEQLTMNRTRSATPELDHQKSMNNLQWHDSRAVSKELPRPHSVTLGGLKSEITEWRR